jgi:uncharacterized membrane protein YfcA
VGTWALQRISAAALRIAFAVVMVAVGLHMIGLY